MFFPPLKSAAWIYLVFIGIQLFVIPFGIFRGIKERRANIYPRCASAGVILNSILFVIYTFVYIVPISYGTLRRHFDLPPLNPVSKRLLSPWKKPRAPSIFDEVK
jgi:hypothetical protein